MALGWLPITMIVVGVVLVIAAAVGVPLLLARRRPLPACTPGAATASRACMCGSRAIAAGIACKPAPQHPPSPRPSNAPRPPAASRPPATSRASAAPCQSSGRGAAAGSDMWFTICNTGKPWLDGDYIRGDGPSWTTYGSPNRTWVYKFKDGYTSLAYTPKTHFMSQGKVIPTRASWTLQTYSSGRPTGILITIDDLDAQQLPPETLPSSYKQRAPDYWNMKIQVHNAMKPPAA